MHYQLVYGLPGKPLFTQIKESDLRIKLVSNGTENVIVVDADGRFEEDRPISKQDFDKELQMKKKRHEDTRTSLHPLSFEEAVKKLVTHKDSQVEESGNTKAGDPESDPPKKKNAPDL